MTGLSYSPVFDESGVEPTEEMRGRIDSELLPGEKLLWASRSVPKPKHSGLGLAVGKLVTAVLLGLTVWAGVMVARDPDNTGAVFITLIVSAELFVFAAIALLAYGAFLKAQRLLVSKTFYALTDNRAILWKGQNRRGVIEVVTVPRGQVVKIHRMEYDDGSGDVVLSYSRKDEGSAWVPCVLEGVSNVREVETLARRILMGGTTTT